MVVSLRAGLICLSLIAAPLSAAKAQDIGVAYDQIAPGTVYEFLDSDENRFWIEVIGATADGYLELAGGFGSNDPTTADHWIGDEDGNAISLQLPSGEFYRYEPHNCRRVIGICSHAEIGPGGERRYVSEIEATPNGFIARHSLIDDAGKQVFQRESTVVLDDNGVVLEAKRTYADGSHYSYRRITNGTS